MKRILFSVMIACSMMLWTGCDKGAQGNSPPKKIANPGDFDKDKDISKNQEEIAPDPPKTP